MYCIVIQLLDCVSLATKYLILSPLFDTDCHVHFAHLVFVIAHRHLYQICIASAFIDMQQSFCCCLFSVLQCSSFSLTVTYHSVFVTLCTGVLYFHKLLILFMPLPIAGGRIIVVSGWLAVHLLPVWPLPIRSLYDHLSVNTYFVILCDLCT